MRYILKFMFSSLVLMAAMVTRGGQNLGIWPLPGQGTRGKIHQPPGKEHISCIEKGI